MSWKHRQGSHISGLTKFHDISIIFPGFSKKFQVYFLNIFNVASNYFWINVYIKISPHQKYIISTVSQASHISGLTKFHDISMIFIIFLQNSMIFPCFPGVLYFSRFSSKCGNHAWQVTARLISASGWTRFREYLKNSKLKDTFKESSPLSKTKTYLRWSFFAYSTCMEISNQLGNVVVPHESLTFCVYKECSNRDWQLISRTAENESNVSVSMETLAVAFQNVMKETLDEQCPEALFFFY